MASLPLIAWPSAVVKVIAASFKHPNQDKLIIARGKKVEVQSVDEQTPETQTQAGANG